MYHAMRIMQPVVCMTMWSQVGPGVSGASLQLCLLSGSSASSKANAPRSERALHRDGVTQGTWQTPGLGSPSHGLSINRLWPIGALWEGTRDTGGRTPVPRGGDSCPPESWTESHLCSVFLGHQHVSVVTHTHSYTYTHTLSFTHALIKPTQSHTPNLLLRCCALALAEIASFHP